MNADEKKYRLMQIKERIREDIAVKEKLLESQSENIVKAADIIFTSLKKGGKLLICGNGGSAADAQHIAGEFVGRFKKERNALPAIALTTNTSILTAIANDYGYEHVFKRQVEALAAKNDAVMGISTSGNAASVINAVECANKAGITTVALTGGGGGKLAEAAQFSIIVPSHDTPRIQESHIVIGHILCQLIEEACCKSRS